MTENKCDEHLACTNISCHGDTLHVGLWYPRCEPELKYIQLGLYDVRAADGIRIFYDFDRDGYVIQQASKFSWDIDDEVCGRDWQEVAFIEAWGREAPDPVDNSKPVDGESK